MWACGFQRVEPCTLSSACLVSCWSVVFGSRHSCLEFRLRVGFQTLALEFAWLCALLSTCLVLLHVVRVFIGCVHSCYVLCCVARSLCISLAACFPIVMFCVNMWLMSIIISCVFVSCSAHGWWFILLAMSLCFLFCLGLSCFVLCAICLHVNCLDPTCLVTWLLIYLPHLFLVTLLNCSL